MSVIRLLFVVTLAPSGVELILLEVEICRNRYLSHEFRSVTEATFQ
jgi:hypothetical protein